MKKGISIFLLAIFLLSTTPLSELLKFPLLVEHFKEHKQENKDITVLEFLNIHYAHGNPRDADYDKDMKLPFKSITNHNSVSSAICISQTFLPGNKIEYLVISKNEFSGYSFTYTSTFLDAIWQPPRV